MKINGTGYSQYIEKVYKENRKDVQSKKENTAKDKSDSIEISSSFREIQKYIDQMKEAQPDYERVGQIKDAIDAGTYRVSSKELAEKIVQKIKEQL
ncbi:MAG: flagellar biosynthesis anti-sigma factor FlgM [Clostridia bacterium]|nr:flagellar biosynthesis anti-sigma factor FlgM [Clostridia bacterium]